MIDKYESTFIYIYLYMTCLRRKKVKSYVIWCCPAPACLLNLCYLQLTIFSSIWSLSVSWFSKVNLVVFVKNKLLLSTDVWDRIFSFTMYHIYFIMVDVDFPCSHFQRLDNLYSLRFILYFYMSHFTLNFY